MTEQNSDELLHYGVKGMKWGVQRSEGGGQIGRAARKAAKKAPVPAVAVRVPGKGVKVVGGKNLPASDDAVTAHVSRTVAKKSGLDALSNAQLKALNERMNMEQQYVKLMSGRGPDQVSVGRQFVNAIIKDPKKAWANAKFAASFVANGPSAATAAAGAAVVVANRRKRNSGTTTTAEQVKVPRRAITGS